MSAARIFGTAGLVALGLVMGQVLFAITSGDWSPVLERSVFSAAGAFAFATALFVDRRGVQP